MDATRQHIEIKTMFVVNFIKVPIVVFVLVFVVCVGCNFVVSGVIFAAEASGFVVVFVESVVVDNVVDFENVVNFVVNIVDVNFESTKAVVTGVTGIFVGFILVACCCFSCFVVAQS